MEKNENDDLKNQVSSLNNVLEVLNPVYHEIVSSNGNRYTSRLVKITPEIATVFLKYNTNNRPLRQAHVNFLTREMLNNNWEFNGDTIRFDTNSKLIDGQYRLNAIIKSGTTQEMWLICGLNDDVFSRIDCGKKRSSSDSFAIENIPNASTAAAVCKNLLHFNNGAFGETGGNSKNYSNVDLLNYYLENQHLEEKVAYGYSVYRKCNRILEPAVICSVYAFLYDKDPDKAKDFVYKLGTGTGLHEKHPILVLRNMLIKAKMEKRPYMYKQLYTLIFHTWDLYISGKTIRSKFITVPDDFKANN